MTVSGTERLRFEFDLRSHASGFLKFMWLLEINCQVINKSMCFIHLRKYCGEPVLLESCFHNIVKEVFVNVMTWCLLSIWLENNPDCFLFLYIFFHLPHLATQLRKQSIDGKLFLGFLQICSQWKHMYSALLS